MTDSYLDEMVLTAEAPPPRPKRHTPPPAVSPWLPVVEFLKEHPDQWGVFHNRPASIASYLRNRHGMYVDTRDAETVEFENGKSGERCTLWVRARTPEEEVEAQKRAEARARRRAEKAQAQESGGGSPDVLASASWSTDDDAPAGNHQIVDHMAEMDDAVEAAGVTPESVDG